MAELHRVTIDGVEYNLPSGGGGGSSVIPNPEGTPTAKLEKIQIEDTIFNIESGMTDVDWRDISGKPEFANVATSGSYNDLSHKPTIPSMEMVDSKVDKEDGKILSSNDFTDEYKSAIDNLPMSYAPVNAQANVIETIKVNGKALTPADKAVSITVPAAVTETTVSGWGFTKNAGTITEIKMNGNSMGSSGVIDLGSVITSLPDISHKVDDTRKVNGKALSSDVTLSANDILTDDNMSIQKRLDELESFESITYKGTIASFDELPTNAANGDMYYCTADKLHYVCVNDPLIDFYEWHEYHTFDDDYIITVEKVANNLTTVSEGYVLDARQGKQLKDAIDNLPSMDNVVLHKDPLGEPSEAVPRDADTLGGKTPEYYAKQSEVNELNQNLTDLLSNVILPIDTSRKIYSDNNLTYTATENCWVEAQVLAQTPHVLAYARVENITFLATAASTSNVAVYNKGCFYVRKGQTVTFNGLSGYYNVYGCISI